MISKIIANGSITPDILKENVPNANPKISPLIFNSAVITFKYPNKMNSINPSILIDNIELKNKS